VIPDAPRVRTSQTAAAASTVQPPERSRAPRELLLGGLAESRRQLHSNVAIGIAGRPPLSAPGPVRTSHLIGSASARASPPGKRAMREGPARSRVAFLSRCGKAPPSPCGSFRNLEPGPRLLCSVTKRAIPALRGFNKRGIFRRSESGRRGNSCSPDIPKSRREVTRHLSSGSSASKLS